jgi:hypothetical protein
VPGLPVVIRRGTEGYASIPEAPITLTLHEKKTAQKWDFVSIQKKRRSGKIN